MATIKYHPDSLLRQRDLLEVLPISPSTLWRYVRNGAFPRPIKLSENCTAWKWSEVKEWIDACQSTDSLGLGARSEDVA